MASISSFGTGGASAAADAGGKLKTQAPKPANESVINASPPRMKYRVDIIRSPERDYSELIQSYQRPPLAEMTKMLLSHELSLKSVAAQVGLFPATRLSEAFKRRFGVDPRLFRDMHAGF